MVKILLKSPQELQYIGQRMADFLQAGDFIALDGDLGAGKTTFVQGLAKGLGIAEQITSPTFTIVQEYEGKLPLYHMDVYRLNAPEEMEDIGYEEYFYGDGVSVVEWANIIRSLWPQEYLSIELAHHPEGRMLSFLPLGEHYKKIIEEMTGYDYSKH